MKITRRQLRRMIFEGVYRAFVGNIPSLYGGNSPWADHRQWKFVAPSTILGHFMSIADEGERFGRPQITPSQYMAAVAKHGKPFQLKKVGEALAGLTSDNPEQQKDIDDTYARAFKDHGSRAIMSRSKSGDITLPLPPKGHYGDLEDEEDDMMMEIRRLIIREMRKIR